jgi:hypothetical protein
MQAEGGIHARPGQLTLFGTVQFGARALACPAQEPGPCHENTATSLTGGSGPELHWAPAAPIDGINGAHYYGRVILSFACAETERVFRAELSRRL